MDISTTLRYRIYMNKKSHERKPILAVFALILIGIYALLFRMPSGQPKVDSKSSMHVSSNTYISEVLAMSFVMPVGFDIQESGNFITLSIGDEAIQIDRISTNANSIQDYLEGLRVKNNLTIEVKDALVVNSDEVVEAMIEQAELTYFVSPRIGRIYTLSTSSPELYDDLTKIVESFEYLGD